jgi:cytochrome c-type biogenesis protein
MADPGSAVTFAAERTETGERTSVTRTNVVLHALAFVAGFTIVFVLLGASASAVSQLLAEHKQLLMRVAGGIVVLLGLNMLGFFRIPLLAMDRRLHFGRAPVSYPASFVAGIGFAAGWTPCIGPVLSAVLAMASETDSLLGATGLLLVYSLGLAVPFLALAIGLRYAIPVLGRVRRWLPVFELVAGSIVLVTGLVLASGSFIRILGWLYARIPALADVGTGPDTTAGAVTIGAAFVAGLVSCISPCVFPLLPGYLSLLTGQTVERISAHALERPVKARRAGGGP